MLFSTIQGLLLAGGRSSRMGSDKALLDIEGIPLYQHMANLLKAAGLKDVRISGSFDEGLEDRVPDKGPLSGIHAALHENSGFQALLIVPVDMPLLSAPLIEKLCSQGLQKKMALCYEGYRMPLYLPMTAQVRHAVSQAIASPSPKDYALHRLHRRWKGGTIPVAESLTHHFDNANTPGQWAKCLLTHSLALSTNVTGNTEDKALETMSHSTTSLLTPLNIAVLTVSDTRTEHTDTSGDLLVDSLKTADHHLSEKVIVKDDIYHIRAVVSRWIASDTIQVVLITGGTGFSGRDSTPEAVSPLFDKAVTGYGELFRQLSYDQVGTSTIQSRTVAGLANGTIIFVMPGSNNACKTAWNGIIKDQLDSRHSPCNFVAQLKKG